MTSPLDELPTWEYRLEAWDDTAPRVSRPASTKPASSPRWDGPRCRVPLDRRVAVDAIVASLGEVRDPTPGWYADPWNLSPARWWDGRQWTGWVSEPPLPERSWIPPRGDRGLAIRGGGIAFVGFLAAITASLVTVLLIELLGGSVHSLEALCAGQAALWVCLFGACKVAVKRHGSGSLRDLGLVPLSRGQVGAGLLIGLVTRFGAGALAVRSRNCSPRNGCATPQNP